jgi:hypothetical protein
LHTTHTTGGCESLADIASILRAAIVIEDRYYNCLSRLQHTQAGPAS